MTDPVRLRLDLSYDGTDFSGWAVQPGRRTVAGELLGALTVLLREPTALVVAGRTDAGVHAVGQVAHIDVSRSPLTHLAPRHLSQAPDTLLAANGDEAPGPIPHGHPASSVARAVAGMDGTAAGRLGLHRRLAGLLPLDVRVRAISVAPQGFDARFSALRRHYRYRIGTADWGVEPADRRFVLARRHPLDVDAMALAAQGLLGLRDFAAFCRPREGATTIRELQALTVARAGDEVHVDVVADAFCHSMVRALVGSLISVGEMRMPTERPAQLLEAGVRTADIHVAPAHGLTLMAVDYPADDELDLRSTATRARRDDTSR
jgi:tRNA pseudouridine38-40 synthase